tara:strand:- start:1981 stop:2346 length:366 start_codon:yes stop_codon:yes gene_type:complete
MTYPKHPNAVTRKKYYEFIQNLPLFLPVEEISGYFTKLLSKYPVAPYLDTNESFIKWMHFIHNKVNEKLEKPTTSLNDFYIEYYKQYKPKNEKILEQYLIKERLATLLVLCLIIVTIYWLY